ncbi:hypothetical protein ACFL5U_04190, partial [Candidatus Margulisiibacteriota bacterium]
MPTRADPKILRFNDARGGSRGPGSRNIMAVPTMLKDYCREGIKLGEFRDPRTSILLNSALYLQSVGEKAIAALAPLLHVVEFRDDGETVAADQVFKIIARGGSTRAQFEGGLLHPHLAASQKRKACAESFLDMARDALGNG